MPGFLGASSGAVGARIRGLGVSGPGGGGSWGTIPYGGGGGSNTEHGTIYIYIYIYVSGSPNLQRRKSSVLDIGHAIVDISSYAAMPVKGCNLQTSLTVCDS